MGNKTMILNEISNVLGDKRGFNKSIEPKRMAPAQGKEGSKFIAKAKANNQKPGIQQPPVNKNQTTSKFKANVLHSPEKHQMRGTHGAGNSHNERQLATSNSTRKLLSKDSPFQDKDILTQCDGEYICSGEQPSSKRPSSTMKNSGQQIKAPGRQSHFIAKLNRRNEAQEPPPPPQLSNPFSAGGYNEEVNGNYMRGNHPVFNQSSSLGQRNTIGHCLSGPGNTIEGGIKTHAKTNSITSLEGQIQGHHWNYGQSNLSNGQSVPDIMNETGARQRLNGSYSRVERPAVQPNQEVPPLPFAKYQFFHVNFDLVPKEGALNSSGVMRDSCSSRLSSLSNKMDCTVGEISSRYNQSQLFNHGMPSSTNSITSEGSQQTKMNKSISPSRKTKRGSTINGNDQARNETMITCSQVYQSEETNEPGPRKSANSQIDASLRNQIEVMSELHHIFKDKLETILHSCDDSLKRNVIYVIKNYKIFLENTMKIMDTFEE
eukprot:TRINITY_DN7785_c0_g1_i1.p1 TRINITY_DN7785_c0_g1~~TRINITY_DN7785_c0_g1_i1.p1  ORF type:complete len:489 (+),score=88.49 TRINITY_DN7785_c0_g1_i1:126-1592(+)